MSITNLPALNRSSATFKADVNTYFGTTLPQFTAELNTEIDRLNTLGTGAYTGTSTTSNTVSTGAKTFTIQAGRGFVVGQPVQVAQTANPATNYMIGLVTSYNSTTGVLVVNVSEVGGSGTFTDWTVSVSSVRSVAVPYVNNYKNRFGTTTTTTLTVPAGVTSMRGYAVGKGGNGSVSTAGANVASGGGAGFAFGDIAVNPGQSVSINIAAGVATVVVGGVTMLTANPGGNASGATAGTAGTASINAAVTNGGAFSGGAGVGATLTAGGASSGSPLGAGVSGNASGGGSSPGGAGSQGGGGLGGLGNQHGAGAGGPAGPTGPGVSRSFQNRFTDPLLSHADGPGGFQKNDLSAVSLPSPGAGGAAHIPITSIASIGQQGGDFGGGGTAYQTNSGAATGGAGGFLSGGGAAYLTASGFTATGGNGGYGGGGAGASAVAGSSAVAGQGGAAYVVLMY